MAIVALVVVVMDGFILGGVSDVVALVLPVVPVAAAVIVAIIVAVVVIGVFGSVAVGVAGLRVAACWRLMFSTAASEDRGVLSAQRDSPCELRSTWSVVKSIRKLRKTSG